MERYYDHLITDGCTYCDTVEESEHLMRWAIDNIKVDPFTKRAVRGCKSQPKFFDGKWRYWVSLTN